MLWINRFIFAAVIVGLPISLASAIAPTKDSLAVVRKNVERERAVLVDVREKAEWDKGHIKDSVLLPLSALKKGLDKKKLEEKLPEKKVLYTFCVVGKRAVTAGGILKELGYEVRPLKPGYKQLLEAGFKKAKKEQDDQSED